MIKQIYKDIRREEIQLLANEYFGVLKNDLDCEVDEYTFLISLLQELYDVAYKEGFMVCKDMIEDKLDFQINVLNDIVG